MTKQIHTTATQLQQHARDLALAFDVRLIEAVALRPEEALGLTHLRVALCAPITDETTYAVALHEMGHLASPTGSVRNVCAGERGNLLRVEEAAAWEWARHYALTWTPAMEAVATWAEGTYAAAAESDRRQAPAAAPKKVPTGTVNWK